MMALIFIFLFTRYQNYNMTYASTIPKRKVIKPNTMTHFIKTTLVRLTTSLLPHLLQEDVMRGSNQSHGVNNNKEQTKYR